MTLKTQMERIINKAYTNTNGIIVLKDGDTVYEKYYNNFNKNSTFHIFSVTKSIISLLIGIAIDKGYIQSIDQKILDFFPDYTPKTCEKTIHNIALKNMLTMTVPYKYKTEPYIEYFSSDNWVESALDLIGGKCKIGEFRYAPLIGPDIFSGILTTATGQSVFDFATKYLFSPLNIQVTDNITFKNKEEQLDWYNQKNTTGWVCDKTGVNTAGWGLSLTPVDMIKIGQLCLNNGMYNDTQLVSKTWITQMTSEHVKCPQYKLSYGYLWWVIDNTDLIYAAMGDGGNIIYVNEKEKIVISIASTFISNSKDRLKLIKDYIEPAFK